MLKLFFIVLFMRKELYLNNEKNQQMNIKNITEKLSNKECNPRFLTSSYFELNNVNVRVSDHLPKIHNLEDYKETFVEHENCFNFFFVLIDFKLSEEDVFVYLEDVKESLEDVLGKEVKYDYYIEEDSKDVDDTSLRLIDRQIKNIH